MTSPAELLSHDMGDAVVGGAQTQGQAVTRDLDPITLLEADAMAVATVASPRIAMVVSDVVMPEMGGLELAASTPVASAS